MKTQHVVVLAAVAAGGVLAYLAWRKGSALFSTTLNPASDQNAAYTGANAALHGIGIVGADDTLGTQLYDWLHTDYDPNVPGSNETLDPLGAGADWLSAIWAAPARVVGAVSGWFTGDGTPAMPAPYDYGQGGAAGVPWALTETSADPAPWWASNTIQ